MKIVIDEDLPRSTTAAMLALGHQVFDVRDYIRSAPDDRVFAFAQEQGAVLMSADLGFANTLTFPLGTHHGIIILRFPNEMPNTEMNQILVSLMEHIPEVVYDGNLVVFTPNRARIRRHAQI